jgi:3',5'-cyclic AMP phosphodiesterase CpdA
MSFTFVVLGDVHALDPARPRPAASEEEREDLARCARVRREIWPKLLAEVRAAAPDFIVQTGDLLHGDASSEEDLLAEAREALDALRSLGAPVWLAQGNHDVTHEPASRRVWDAVVRPHLARQLGRSLDHDYFHFSASGARFFVLDYRDTGPEQMAWLRKALREDGAAGGGDERVFLVAHAPLYPVARPFFSEPAFTEGVRQAIGDRPVDTYFCGHTHNQCVSLHPWGGTAGEQATGRLLQVQSAVMGEPGREPIPLMAVRAPLHAGSPEVLWGYLEDTAPGWVHGTVDDGAVTLEWQALGRGRGEWLRWREPGVAEAMEAPQAAPAGLGREDARRIRSGRVFMAFWGSEDPEKEVRLNGVPIGCAPVTDWYSPRSCVPIPAEALGAVRQMNEVVIANPRGEEFVVGGVYLEVTLDDGRRVRSTPSDFLFATGSRWDAWEEPTMLRVAPGEPAELRALRFALP